jgi:hypothetical protein
LQVIFLADGYECQEFNSVFMLTFPHNSAAVRFGLILQQLLLIYDWPPEVLELPGWGEVVNEEGLVRVCVCFPAYPFDPARFLRDGCVALPSNCKQFRSDNGMWCAAALPRRASGRGHLPPPDTRCQINIICCDFQ